MCLRCKFKWRCVSYFKQQHRRRRRQARNRNPRALGDANDCCEGEQRQCLPATRRWIKITVNRSEWERATKQKIKWNERRYAIEVKYYIYSFSHFELYLRGMWPFSASRTQMNITVNDAPVCHRRDEDTSYACTHGAQYATSFNKWEWNVFDCCGCRLANEKKGKRPPLSPSHAHGLRWELFRRFLWMYKQPIVLHFDCLSGRRILRVSLCTAIIITIWSDEISEQNLSPTPWKTIAIIISRRFGCRQ